jgi:hypothetical protein
MTKRELAQKQLDLMNDIRAKANINIVTCGNCGTILLHEMELISDIEFISFKDDDNSIECYDCKTKMDLCDCPDLWYDGCIENMEFANSIMDFEGDELELTNQISFEDVVNIATDLKMNPSIAEMNEVLRLYPNEEKENPDWNWSEIVENLLYNCVVSN